MTLSLKSILPVAGVLLIGVGSSYADVVGSQYFAPDNYYYRITHMPDFDQRREAVPGIPGLANSGSMFCVPTASTNVLAYMANHGFPSVTPGPASWTPGDPVQYDLITVVIGNDVGLKMGTSPTGGTSGNGWFSGMNQLVPLDKFTVTHQYSSGTYSPTVHEMALAAIQGSVISLSYGFYSEVGMMGGFPVLNWTGGHIVTLAKATGDIFSGQALWVRDPADDASNLTTQSNFMNRKWDVLDKTVVIGTTTLTMQNLVVPGSTTSSNYLNAFMSVTPKHGVSFTPGGTILGVIYPFNFSGLGPARRIDQSLVEGATIIDFAFHPDLHSQVVLQADETGDTVLTVINGVNGTATDIGTFPGAEKIFFGRKRVVYVLEGLVVYCVSYTEPLFPIEANVTLPGIGDALTYNDATDEVVILSNVEHSILRYSQDLTGLSVLAIPGAIPMSGNASIAAPPPALGMAPDKLYFSTAGAPKIYGITSALELGGVVIEEITLASAPTSFDFDDEGHIFAMVSGAVVELMLNPASGLWDTVPVADSEFDPFMTGDEILRISRSRTNYDPGVHDAPEWNTNIDPDLLEFGEAVLDCNADLNDDRLVNVTDLLSLLADWGDCGFDPCVGDVNGEGNVNVTDLLALLAAWGACP